MASASPAAMRRIRWAARTRATFFSLNPAGVVRCRRQRPEVEKPVGPGIIGQLDCLCIISPELLADSVGKPVALLFQILGYPRPLAQFDHQRVEGHETAEAVKRSRKRSSCLGLIA